jgi:hypothetical protein
MDTTAQQRAWIVSVALPACRTANVRLSDGIGYFYSEPRAERPFRCELHWTRRGGHATGHVVALSVSDGKARAHISDSRGGAVLHDLGKLVDADRSKVERVLIQLAEQVLREHLARSVLHRPPVVGLQARGLGDIGGARGAAGRGGMTR